MKTPLFTGSGVAIVTPFQGDSINYSVFGKLIDFHIENGTSAIIVNGTTGEASTQSLEEHIQAVDFCVRHVAGRIKVIAGAGSNDTSDALMLSQSAEQSGADGLLIVTPYYNKTTQTGLVKHYFHIADRVDIPIIMYNIPGRTGMGITESTYFELSKHPNINGVKEASGNFTLILNTRYLCGDDLNIWSGNDDQIVPLMSLGGKGVISVVANILPRLTADITRLCLEGRFSEAAELQVKYAGLIDALFVEVNPIPIKTAMNLMGMDVGPLRMPLCDMSDKNLAVLKDAMVSAGIKV